VQHNLIDVSEKVKDGNPKFLVIYKIQKLKRMIEVNDPKRHDETALKEIFTLITQPSEDKSSSSPPNITPDRNTHQLSPEEQFSLPIVSGESAPPPQNQDRSIVSPTTLENSLNPPIGSEASDPVPISSRESTLGVTEPSTSSPEKASSPRILTERSSMIPEEMAPLAIMSSVSSSCSSSVCLDHHSYICDRDRAELLLELGFLSLRTEQHEMTRCCLKELRHSELT
ncbi:hypothetical protein DNTS_032488, partial [Danionella cerebrum]